MINPKRNGMIQLVHAPQERGSVLPHKSSANGTRVPLVTYKNVEQCNGLLFSLILHAPTIQREAQEDKAWAIWQWREFGFMPERFSQVMKGTIRLH